MSYKNLVFLLGHGNTLWKLHYSGQKKLRNHADSIIIVDIIFRMLISNHFHG